jgi:formylglycine-generating enzyme
VTEAPKAAIRPPDVVPIPGGVFRMGAEDGRADETPAHDVELSPFFLGRTPVTRA